MCFPSVPTGIPGVCPSDAGYCDLVVTLQLSGLFLPDIEMLIVVRMLAIFLFKGHQIRRWVFDHALLLSFIKAVRQIVLATHL